MGYPTAAASFTCNLHDLVAEIVWQLIRSQHISADLWDSKRIDVPVICARFWRAQIPDTEAATGNAASAPLCNCDWGIFFSVPRIALDFSWIPKTQKNTKKPKFAHQKTLGPQQILGGHIFQHHLSQQHGGSTTPTR